MSRSKSKTILGVYVSFYYPIFKFLTVVLSIALLIVIIFSTMILIADKKNLTKYSIFIIGSNSMAPELKKDDIVIVEEKSKYNVDDIITYIPDKNNDESYTHRIIEIEEKSGKKRYITKGDNNKVTDSFTVYKDHIQGTVIKVIKGYGSIVTYLRSIPGIILFIIVPVTILVTLNISSLYRWIKEIYYKEKGGL